MVGSGVSRGVHARMRCVLLSQRQHRESTARGLPARTGRAAVYDVESGAGDDDRVAGCDTADGAVTPRNRLLLMPEATPRTARGDTRLQLSLLMLAMLADSTLLSLGTVCCAFLSRTMGVVIAASTECAATCSTVCV